MSGYAWAKFGEQQLAALARESKAFAEALEEPIKFRSDAPAIGIEEDARAAVEALLADGKVVVEHGAALSVIRIMLNSPQPVLRTRVSKGDNVRHWAIFTMMARLLDTTEFYPERACRGACERPSNDRPAWHCAAVVDEADGAATCIWPRRCAKSVDFPYPNPHAAAQAVVEGFKASAIDTTLTVDRVLKHYQRHFKGR